MNETVIPILYTHELARAVRFYRDLLGMTESYRFPPEGDPVFITLRWGNAEIGLGTYDPVPGLEGRHLSPPKEGRGFELCVYVPDVDELVRRLRDQGVRILVPPTNEPWVERLAYVEDSEGNAIMLAART